MMRSEFARHLPPKALDYFCAHIPPGSVPHHSFHVLYLQTITGVIEKTVKNQDQCRISWGQVTEKGERLTVKTQKLKVEKNRYILQECTKKVDYLADGKQFTDAGAGDIVAIHWGLAVDRLEKEQAKRLHKYTTHNLERIRPTQINKAPK